MLRLYCRYSTAATDTDENSEHERGPNVPVRFDPSGMYGPRLAMFDDPHQITKATWSKPFWNFGGQTKRYQIISQRRVKRVARISTTWFKSDKISKRLFGMAAWNRLSLSLPLLFSSLSNLLSFSKQKSGQKRGFACCVVAYHSKEDNFK